MTAARGTRTAARRRVAALLGLLAVVTLSGSVIGSAAGLGGAHPQQLGAGDVQTRELAGLDIQYAPHWDEGDWRLGSVTLTGGADRGFRAGDQISMSVHAPGRTCEASAVTEGAVQSVTLTEGMSAPGCAITRMAPRDVTTVAISVTGTDGITRTSTIGNLSGSLAAFSGALLDTGRVIHGQADTEVVGQQNQITQVHLRLPGTSVSEVDGASIAVVLPGTGQTRGTVSTAADAPVRVQSDPGGGSLITLVTDQAWAIEGEVEVYALLATTQHLSGPDAPGAISTTSWTVTAEPVAPPPAKVDHALQPVSLTPGLEYDYTWTGGQGNLLEYCHNFTVTNVSDVTVPDWTVQFDGSLAPLWGANPQVPGTITYNNIETRAYDEHTGLWTLGAIHDWHRVLQPGATQHFGYCAERVPTPEPDPSQFEVSPVRVGGGDWHVTFTIEVTSTSQFHVPWSVEVDFADLVCPASLAEHPLDFSRVLATPIEGSTTRYLIQGTPGDTQLISRDQPRVFTFAQYGPAPGWQLPCPEGA